MKLTMYQAGGTDAAYLFSTTPRDQKHAGFQVWIPKSQINHISRRAPIAGQWTECEVTMSDWIAKQKGLE